MLAFAGEEDHPSPPLRNSEVGRVEHSNLAFVPQLHEHIAYFFDAFIHGEAGHVLHHNGLGLHRGHESNN